MAPRTGEAEGEVGGCCRPPRKGASGTRILGSPRLLTVTPLFPEGYRGNQCRARARPSLRLRGELCPSWDRAQGPEEAKHPPPKQEDWNATDSTVTVTTWDRQGHEGRISSRDRGGREQPPVGEMLGEPQPPSSPETKAGGCKVWQFGLQVLVSIRHPGRPLASLGPCASAPQGEEEAALPAATVCLGRLKGPVKWALWSLKLGRWGAEGGESGHLSPGW